MEWKLPISSLIIRAFSLRIDNREALTVLPNVYPFDLTDFLPRLSQKDETCFGDQINRGS